MKSLRTYLTFDGNCEEALTFYVQSLGAEIASIQRFSEMPGDVADVPEEAKNNIMHASLKAGDVLLMASDNMPGQSPPMIVGNNVTLSLDMENESEQTAVFEKLSQGGSVNMPLQDTFWGSRFGMLTDKFGIHWMLSLAR